MENERESTQKAQVNEVLREVLQLWEGMKTSDMEDDGDDADRFQMKFYVLTEAIREWIGSLESRPKDADTARRDARFADLFAALPEELEVPFELELDSALSDSDGSVDSTEQG